MRVGWGAVLNGGGSPDQLWLRMVGDHTLTVDYGGALTALVEQPDGAHTNNGGAFSGTWAGRTYVSNWAAAMHVDTSRACAR